LTAAGGSSGRRGPAAPGKRTKESMTNHDKARALWELGNQCLMEGQIEDALQLFEKSIVEEPTAEGYTYRGWAISYLGKLDEAIENCKTAIELDPDFGNPYNDIGVYLMQKGQLDNAIPWLEKAKTAKRYEPRHFPHLNLGRIYVAKGDSMGALDEFMQALEIHPDDETALKAIANLNYPVN
jgi:Tfp pilus assembly protein PilF